MKTAGDAYIDTELGAWKDYVTKANRIDAAYVYATSMINGNPSFDGAGYITSVANGSGNNSGYGPVAYGGGEESKGRWYNASENGLNDTLWSGWKWVSKQNGTLYSIDHCTIDIERDVAFSAKKQDKLSRGESIDVKEVLNSRKAPETATGAIQTLVNTNLLFTETSLFLATPKSFWGQLFSREKTYIKPGTITIEEGAKPTNFTEELAATAFAKNGYNVIRRKTANDSGFRGVQTSDFIVEQLGKVEVYTPETVSIKNITDTIASKKDQASIIAVYIDKNPVVGNNKSEIAARVFGKPEAKPIQQIIFIQGDDLFSYTRKP